MYLKIETNYFYKHNKQTIELYNTLQKIFISKLQLISTHTTKEFSLIRQQVYISDYTLKQMTILFLKETISHTLLTV